MLIKKATVAAVLAAAGMAASSASMAQQKPEDAGFYIGGHFGQSDVKELDETDTSWKILGGYQINRNFAVELGYIDFGKITLSGPGGTATFESTAFELMAVAGVPVADRFSIYGKFGFYRADSELNFNIPALGGAFSGSETNNDITFGVGARFDVTRNLGIRAEWQRYSDVGDGATDIDVMSVGVIYRF
jgi:OmpA-OmpF porin, OOP family